MANQQPNQKNNQNLGARLRGQLPGANLIPKWAVQETIARWSVIFKDRKIDEAELNLLVEEFWTSFRLIELRVDDYEAVIGIATARATFFPTPGDINFVFDELKKERNERVKSERGRYVEYIDPNEGAPEEQATDEERAERIAITQMAARGEISPDEAFDRQKEIADKIVREGRAGVCRGVDLHFALGAGKKRVPGEFVHIGQLVKGYVDKVKKAGH